jgi:endonuclease-3
MATRKMAAKQTPATRKSTETGAAADRALTSRAKKIIALLEKEYPEIQCPLNHSNSLELLIATILSAQCTDARVNMVTPQLFGKYTSAADWAAADQTVLEREIKTTGFFRNKAKAIRACCGELVERFGGRVPESIDELASLPGVGRKTANVVMGYAYGKPAIMVDTHMRRVSGRLELTSHTDPDKIELDLVRLVPANDRTGFSHRLIQHGRRVCVARKPRCEACCLGRLCPFPTKQ